MLITPALLLESIYNKYTEKMTKKKKSKYTTIRVTRRRTDDLTNMAKKNETYDDVIADLIKENRRMKKQLEEMLKGVKRA